MDLQSLGALGEFVGAIGVIMSLVYLGMQVRQAHRVSRAENIRELQAGLGRLWMLIGQDRQVAELYFQGCDDPERLEPVQRGQFEYLLAYHLNFFVECHEAHRGGLMDERIYERWRRWTAIVLASPGAARWWARTNKLYRDDVIRALEELRGKVPAPHSFLGESKHRGPAVTTDPNG